MLFLNYEAADWASPVLGHSPRTAPVLPENSLELLQRLVVDIQSERKLGRDSLPLEMRIAPVVSDGSSGSSGSDLSTLTGGSDFEQESKKQRTTNTRGAAFASAFTADLGGRREP